MSQGEQRYPILVEDFGPRQAMAIICESCGAEAQINAETLRNEGRYACPAGCLGTAVHKYELRW